MRQSSEVGYSVPPTTISWQPAANYVPLNFYGQHLCNVSHDSKNKLDPILSRHLVHNLCCMFNLNVQVDYINVLLYITECSSIHKLVIMRSHAHKDIPPDHVQLKIQDMLVKVVYSQEDVIPNLLP